MTPNPLSLPLALAKGPTDGHTLMEELERRAGRRARDLAAIIQQWGHVVDELGREPTTPEYAAHWRISEATARRDLAAFRDAFPGEQTPSRLLELAWDGIAQAQCWPQYRGLLVPLLGVRVIARS